MKFMAKLLLSLLFALIALLLSLNLHRFFVVEEVVPQIERELETRATTEFLERRIEEALSRNDLEEGREFLELARSLRREIDGELVAELERREGSVEQRWEEIKEFTRGFLKGEADGRYSLAGSLVSDLTIVGDLRDLYREGKRYIGGEEYDPFILGLSAVGVGLGLSTVASLGGTAPLKSGVSLLKVARRSKALTGNFTRRLVSRLSRSVDLRMVKEMDFTSLRGLRRSSSKLLERIDLSPLRRVLKDLEELSKNGSPLETLEILKYVEDERDLRRAVKLSRKFRGRTATVLKVLGKGALRGSRIVVKRGRYYGLVLFSAFLSVLLSLTFLVAFLVPSLKRLGRRRKPPSPGDPSPTTPSPSSRSLEDQIGQGGTG
ncbi:MAG: hypothetical protein GXO19_03555 [Epsilonproteobacteria bacterium]|nr:hypothetical protein [Campylobacterota bacterium]NPA56795.1 hypothetical protein [Campylobacterota bacterium]